MKNVEEFINNENKTFKDFKHSFSLEKFYSISVAKFLFEEGLNFKYTLENDKKITEISLEKTGEIKFIVEFFSKSNYTIISKMLNFTKIFEASLLEIKSFFSIRECEFSLFLFNNNYKVYLKKCDFNKNNNVNVMIYSLKHNDQITFVYDFNQNFENFEGFLKSINFELGLLNEFQEIINSLLITKKISNFEDLFNFYFDEIKIFKEINKMVNY